jgi:lipoprotein-releasing system permease protein
MGTVIGSLLGIVFTLNIETIRQKLEGLTGTKLFDPVIYFLTSLPAELSIANTIIIIVVSLILSFLATIYPAWKAASLMPAVALRYE